MTARTRPARRAAPLFALAVSALLVPVRDARAQCPDGSPPPCRRPAPASRAAPALDDRTWIVLPFENVARAPDIEWLRDASVNLLYLDLSRWRDIRVIDDERVADLMRAVPDTRRRQLSLQTGLAVARRAGAGKLVMGDLLMIGRRTAVVAKVFDVRSGQRVRTVREETADPDSLMNVFGRLARGILDVDAETVGGAATAGTTSLRAYQVYLAGVDAMNRWDLDSAAARFGRALALDSTFALAHYKLAVVLGWGQPNDRSRRAHAEAAARLAGALPAREQALIRANLAQVRDDWTGACDIYRTLLRADSNDVEAWYNLGECTYHDPVALVLGEDSAQLRFRTSWNESIGAFQRALELDPSYHLAFQHILDALQAAARGGCLLDPVTGGCKGGERYRVAAPVAREGDSLVTAPAWLFPDGSEYTRRSEAVARTTARRDNLVAAQRLARRWLDAGPGEVRSRLAVGRISLALGQVDEAAQHLRQVAPRPSYTSSDGAQLAVALVETAVKQGRFAEARALADSLAQALGAVPQARIVAGLVGAVFGRFGLLAEAVNHDITAPVPVRTYFVEAARALAGAPADSLTAAQDSVAELLRARGAGEPGARATLTIFAPVLIWGPRRPLPQWPAHDTATTDTRLRLVTFLASGDTARTRRALIALDSALAVLPAVGHDAGALLASAEVHLALGDSAAALQQLLHFERRWPQTPMTDYVANFPAASGLLWARSFLLLADLAAARGDRIAAVRNYRRVVGLWQEADPPLQPTVSRARQALAELGAT